ncbi:MAG: CBS domain-containing protein [Planctomycetaceae bacterium]
MLTERLRTIREQIDKGVVPPPETVRNFLTWFGVTRRGSRTVSTIRQSLDDAELDTDPDFEFAFIDAQIYFIRAGSKRDPSPQQETFRIGRLESANRKPVSIKPDNPLSEAVTLMLTHDFSQLPVMTSDREVKGIISWKTIGSRLALKQECVFVRECIEQPRIVQIDDSLFTVISDISEHDYVLVQAPDRTICGIVTATDFSEQFRKLGEPFLLVGEIENSIRKLIHGKFTASELADVKDPDDQDRKVAAVSDLTFGEYVRLLENEKRWLKVGLALDRVEFVKRLEAIREIRNDIMHFEPEGIPESDMKTLQDFSKFMNRLRLLGAIG